MIKNYFLFSLICLNTFAQSYQLNAFNNVIFYDGYAATKQLPLLLELFV